MPKRSPSSPLFSNGSKGMSNDIFNFDDAISPLSKMDKRMNESMDLDLMGFGFQDDGGLGEGGHQK